MKKMTFCLLAILAASSLLAGCQAGSQSSMSKTEEDAMRKPVGQPMPPEAKAAMERARAGNGGPPPQALQPPPGAPR